MGNFYTAVFSFPTAVFTALLGIVLVYWVLALVGLVDFEHSGLDLELETQADADPSELGTLATYVVAFGLSGVPFSVAVSLVVLYGWVASCLAGMWLQALVPAGGLGGLMPRMFAARCLFPPARVSAASRRRASGEDERGAAASPACDSPSARSRSSGGRSFGCRMGPSPTA